MAPTPQIAIGAWAVLALLGERDTHGWTLVRALEPGGEIGRVWSIKRALVYRTIDQVIDAGLVERAGAEPGDRGSSRTLLRATRSGRKAIDRWLSEPVAHVRDLRSELLLKLLFAERSGRDRAPLLRAQQATLTELLQTLDAQLPSVASPETTVQAFRLEAARAGLRFVDGELARLSGDR
jgi:DNA-binding PadR family transcriptional regulator